MTARSDYCSTLYTGLHVVHLGCLERVIRAAAHVIGGIHRAGHVSALLNTMRATDIVLDLVVALSSGFSSRAGLPGMKFGPRFLLDSLPVANSVAISRMSILAIHC